MRRFGLAGLALFLVVLAACSSDSTSSSDVRIPGPEIIRPLPAVPNVTSCSAADIETHINALMGVITPNQNAALSKFQTVEALMAQNTPAATAEARDYAQNTLLVVHQPEIWPDLTGRLRRRIRPRRTSCRQRSFASWVCSTFRRAIRQRLW